jgi:hypothetical protein
MDLYPDVGTRLGELREGFLVRWLTRFMRRAYQGAYRVVALDEDMRDYLREHYGIDAYVIPPFPPEVHWPCLPAPTGAGVWLYSGNLGRAHEIDALLQVQERLEACQMEAALVLQGQGAQLADSRQAAAKLQLRRVTWRPPTPQAQLGESLLQADVLVVSRRAELKGLLLPSKLVLAELSGRAILWIGDTDGHTAQLLQKRGHGVFAADQIAEIAAWLRKTFQTPPRQNEKPQSTQSCRARAIRRWLELLAS